MIKANSQCSSAIQVPAVINGITITASGTGSISTYGSQTSGCVTSPNNSLWLGQNGGFSYTYNFSAPVNNLIIVLTDADKNVNGIVESFTFTTNGNGNTKIDVAGCGGTLSILNNTLTATGSASAGYYKIYDETSNFTTLTISGPGGNTGSMYMLCSEKIEPDICIGTKALATPITPTTLTNTSYHWQLLKLDHDLTIDGDAYFGDCEVIINPNVKITVLPNATLNINSSHFHTCSGMWKGIVVLPGGKVDLQGKNHNLTTIIEDADIAVNYSFPSGTTTYNDGLLLNTGFTIFNRNRIGVKISNYQSDSRNKTIFPFDFDHCVFTSRKIDLPNPKVATASDPGNNPTITYNEFLYNSTLNPIPYTLTSDAPLKLASPYISNNNYPDDVTEAFLKTSTPNQKPDAGIVLEDVALQQLTGNIEVGSTSCCPPVEISPNVFDNLNIGIDANASNVNVQSCVFQKPPINTPNAVGIRLSNGSTNKARIGLQNSSLDYSFNAFYDMPTAIKANNFDDLTINYNIFRSSRSTQVVDNNGYGENGVFAISKGFKKLLINNNEFTNLNTGMLISDQALNTVQASGNIQIRNNTLQALHPSIPVVGGESFVYGIVFNGGSISNNSNMQTLVCSDNELKKVSFGIAINNLVGKDFDIKHNTISVVNTTNPTDSKYGIGLFGGSPDVDGIVEENIITGSCITCNQSGIFLNKQLNTTVECNIIGGTMLNGNIPTAGLTHGFRFVDANTGTNFRDNMMYSSNKYGFTLEASGGNGGAIGQQGSLILLGQTTDCNSGNSWGATATDWNTLGHRMTNVVNSDATLSPLVVTQNIWTNPDGSGTGTGFPPITYQTSNNSIYTILSETPGCPHCTIGVKMLGKKKKRIDPLLLQIADGSIDIPVTDPDLYLYVLQQQLFSDLKDDDDPSTIMSYPELQTFMAEKNWGSYDFIYYTPQYLAQGNVNSVEMLLEYFPSENIVDDNYWKYYTWLNEMQKNPDYKPDLQEVFALANQCPAQQGLVVFAARNLYMQLTEKVTNFENVCEEGVPTSRKLKNTLTKRIVAGTLNNKVQVYPNPSNGVVNIQLPLLNSGKWNVTVTDIYGKTIMNKPLTNTSSQLDISNVSGLYIATITNTQTGEQVIKKIVVN